MAKGRKASPETRAKMRAAHLGRKLDATVKAKISATMRRKWQLIEQLEREQRTA